MACWFRGGILPSRTNDTCRLVRRPLPKTLPFETHTILKVYDFLGREVAVLVNRVLGAGVHQVSFEAGLRTSGLYIYRLVAGGRVMAKKMQLVK